MTIGACSTLVSQSRVHRHSQLQNSYAGSLIDLRYAFRESNCAWRLWWCHFTPAEDLVHAPLPHEHNMPTKTSDPPVSVHHFMTQMGVFLSVRRGPVFLSAQNKMIIMLSHTQIILNYSLSLPSSERGNGSSIYQLENMAGAQLASFPVAQKPPSIIQFGRGFGYVHVSIINHYESALYIYIRGRGNATDLCCIYKNLPLVLFACFSYESFLLNNLNRIPLVN